MRRALLLFVALVSVPRAARAQGEPLGPEFRVNTYTTNSQLFSFVASDSVGDFVVVWASSLQDGFGLGVFGQRYSSSGSPVGLEFRVNTYTTGDQVFPSVGSDSLGNFVVVWTGDFQDGSSLGVFGQRYAASGAPIGLEFRVNTYTTGFQGGSTVASDSAGNFVVIWGSYGQDGQASGMFGQRYASSGVPLGPEFRVNTYTTGFQGGRSLAFDSAGNFVIVWMSVPQDGSMEGVFGQRYASSGAPLGPEFRVNTYTTGPQRYPSVTVDPSGNFTVVWESNDGSVADIVGQRYAGSGAPLGTEFRINTYTTGFRSRPSIASDASGNFVVAWHDYVQDGSAFGVFGQRYAGSGAPLGSEFRVNSYTTSSQSYPLVTADASGNFVVIWESQTQDGSGLGIFGQRYGRIVPVELMHFRVQ